PCATGAPRSARTAAKPRPITVLRTIPSRKPASAAAADRRYTSSPTQRRLRKVADCARAVLPAGGGRCLDAACEVVRVDRQPVAVVEAMRRKALRACPRVEMKLPAAKPSGLGLEPGEQSRGVAPIACLRERGEVVHVEMASPRQAVAEAESR